MLGVDLPVESGPDPLVPAVGPPGRVTVERLIALGRGGELPRSRRLRHRVDGQRTRWRVLFRADGLSELTETDLAVMRELGIRTVVDLRSGHEVEQSRFDVEAHPVTFHHFPFIKSLPDAEDFDRAPGFLGTQYTEMLDDATPQIVGALSALAAPEARPAVFHCTAGKDRTGLLSALVLSLLGVPEETVVADYALSGAAMDRLRAKLVEKYPDGKGLIADSDVLFSADPANMVALFAHLRDRYGTVAGYADGGRGPGRRGVRLRQELLEPATGRSRRQSGRVGPSSASGRRRSMAAANARSSTVSPPALWVLSTRRTLFQRMSMSG